MLTTVGDVQRLSGPVVRPTIAPALQELVTAVSDLPMSVLEAKEGDVLYVLATGSAYDVEDDDDPWEVLDHVLNQVFGFSKTVEEISMLVRRGTYGMNSVVETMSVFVERYRIDPQLLEGKARRMQDAIVLLTRTQEPDPYPNVTVLPWYADIPTNDSDVHVPSPIPACPPSPAGQMNTSSQASSPDLMHADSTSTQTRGTSARVPEQARDAPTNRQQHAECQGLCLQFPPKQSANTAYPFLLHETAMVRFGINGVCTRCKDLEGDTVISNIIKCAHDGVSEGTQFQYLGMGHLVAITRKKNNTIAELRLKRLNSTRRVDKLVGAVELHKELIVTMSCQKVQRVDTVLRAGFRCKAGLKSILEMIKLAGAGLYCTQGYTAEEELHALLLYRLGGARVLNIAHQVSGMLSTSTIHHHISLVSIIPSATHPTCAEAEANVMAAFKPVRQVIEAAAEGDVTEARVLHGALLIDEIAVMKRLRYDDRTNKIISLCRDCEVGEGREFVSEKDLDVLFDDIEHVSGLSERRAPGLHELSSKVEG
ncbi:hypothetical protein K488DRAFT_91062 [Vararia minispora EC-137]|uniref:Uncharacterized protein n=1 Tax=Vararia minispora EC-137 TaxID=1314806 RepID=A0ACB8Q799_9AGAM|nr:hypothetical protein K488DRAFT_91062 [Vararia minispora EC-137]